MKKLILFFLFFKLVLGYDFFLLKTYKEQGVKKIKLFLDKSLMDQFFWKEYLSEFDLKYGYFEKPQFLIIVNKSQKKLQVFKYNKRLQKIFETDVLIGKNKGDKESEGDLKTPNGVYKLTQKLTKLDSFYGPFALETNYPNEFDKLLGRNGHGIWIHGVPTKDSNKKRSPYTKGCVAMDNDNLCKLDKKIILKDSILIISEKKFNSNLDEISFILSKLYSWKFAWEYNDFNKYISFYAKDFKRFNGWDYEKFFRYKKRVFNKNEKKEIIFKNINIIPYPNAKNEKIYKITFFEDFKSTNYRFKGDKILYIKIKNNDFKIIAEK